MEGQNGDEFLSQIREDFYEQFAGQNLQARCELLNTIETLIKNSKFEDGDCRCLLRALKNIIKKDSSVACVQKAASCIAGLAAGLKKKFQSFAGNCIRSILERLYNEQSELIAALRRAADAVLLTTTLEDMLEDVLDGLYNENPRVKTEMSLLLVRRFKTKTSLNEEQFEAITTALNKNIKDQDYRVIQATAEAFRALLKLERKSAGIGDGMLSGTLFPGQNLQDLNALCAGANTQIFVTGAPCLQGNIAQPGVQQQHQHQQAQQKQQTLPQQHQTQPHVQAFQSNLYTQQPSQLQLQAPQQRNASTLQHNLQPQPYPSALDEPMIASLAAQQVPVRALYPYEHYHGAGLPKDQVFQTGFQQQQPGPVPGTSRQQYITPQQHPVCRPAQTSCSHVSVAGVTLQHPHHGGQMPFSQHQSRHQNQVQNMQQQLGMEHSNGVVFLENNMPDMSLQIPKVRMTRSKSADSARNCCRCAPGRCDPNRVNNDGIPYCSCCSKSRSCAPSCKCKQECFNSARTMRAPSPQFWM